MGNIADLFYQQAQLYPTKTAVVCEDKQISYRELSQKVSRISNLLLENGIKYKDIVAIPMSNSITSISLIFAAANLGISLVPFNPTLPNQAVKLLFKNTKVKHIIAARVFFDTLDSSEILSNLELKICIDDKEGNSISLLDEELYSNTRPKVTQISGNEALIVTATSGSTGQPKPIILTQKTKYERANAHIELYNITQEDIILVSTPLYHSLAERLVIIPLIIGATCVLMTRYTSQSWLNSIVKNKITFTISVSAQLGQLAKELEQYPDLLANLNSLRCLVSSSSLLTEEVKLQLISKLKCDFHEMYGTSEVSTVTNIQFDQNSTKHASVGRPLPQAKVIILRDEVHQAGTGEIGEIVCKTSLICDGYLGLESGFQQSLWQDYFKTGDLGYIDEDGYLYYYGRKKEIIITGGINVYPLDIENCICQLEGVNECAAFAYPDERLGELVAVAIVVDSDVKLRKRDIRNYCAKHLADFQQPQKIFFISALPKNSMGKLVRSQIIDVISKGDKL